MIQYDDVRDLLAEPLDEMYDEKQCVDECSLAGTMKCKPYREWLRAGYFHELQMNITPCADFKSWRQALSEEEWKEWEADGFGAGYL